MDLTAPATPTTDDTFVKKKIFLLSCTLAALSNPSSLPPILCVSEWTSTTYKVNEPYMVERPDSKTIRKGVKNPRNFKSYAHYNIRVSRLLFVLSGSLHMMLLTIKKDDAADWTLLLREVLNCKGLNKCRANPDLFCASSRSKCQVSVELLYYRNVVKVFIEGTHGENFVANGFLSDKRFLVCTPC